MDQKDVYVGYRSVIASITEEHGIGFYQIRDTVTDAAIFLDYLKKLRQ